MIYNFSILDYCQSCNFCIAHMACSDSNKIENNNDVVDDNNNNDNSDN